RPSPLPCSPAHLPLLPFPTRRSSDLVRHRGGHLRHLHCLRHLQRSGPARRRGDRGARRSDTRGLPGSAPLSLHLVAAGEGIGERSEEHRLNSSHVSISYAVFCLKKKI